MTVLIFNDRGWQVATAAWSAGAKGEKAITICYQWGADGTSLFDGATGNARCELEMTMAEFINRLRRPADGVVDLR